MMHDTWTDQLSDYLDGGMDRSQRDSLEAHLTSCPECSAVLEELKSVRAKAHELNEAPVPRELWSRIERAIAAPDAAPRVTRLTLPRGRFSLPELLAACLAVAVISGGTVFAMLRHQAAPVAKGPVTVAQAPERAPTQSSPEPTEERGETDSRETSEPARSEARTVDAVPAMSRQQEIPLQETPNEEAITELRKVLASRRDRLDPATIRTLETNLAIIDLAIDQAKRALVADSANTYVKEHLAETMRRKVELLQRATMLASASGSEGPR